MNKINKIALTIWVLLAAFMLVGIDWQFGGLRFTSRGATLLAGFAALWLPVVCAVLLGFLPRSRSRLWAFVCLIPMALIILIVGTMLSVGQSILLLTRQSEVRLSHSEVVTYFADAGAWDSGEVIVQQEIKLLPGFVWVKPLSRKACLRDVKITVLDRHHVRCYYPMDKTDSIDPDPEAKQEDIWVL